MNEKDRCEIKNTLHVLVQKLKDNPDSTMLELLISELSNTPLYREKIDSIYECAVESILSRQSKLCYENFPIESIKSQLITDFVRMEKFRRQDNFEDYCLATFQQVESIVNALYKTMEVKILVSSNIEKKIFPSSVKTFAELIYSDAEHRKESDYEKMYFTEKLNAILLWVCFRGNYQSSYYEEYKKRGMELYQCRNLNHRGGDKSDYQQKILDSII